MKLYRIALGYNPANAPEDQEFHVVAHNIADIEKHFIDVEEVKLIDDIVVIIDNITNEK